MSHLATCPHCERAIQIASLALEWQRLRCPLCAEPFEIGDVAKTAVPAPPLAEPYVDELAEVLMPAAATTETSGGDPAMFDITGSSAEGAPELPEFVGEDAIESFDDVGVSELEWPSEFETPGELDDPLVESEAAATETGEPQAEGLTFDFAQDMATEEPATEQGFDLAESASGEEGFSLAEPAFAPEGARPATESLTARRKRSQPQGNPVLMILGIVVGGVVGLSLGYVILVVIGELTGQDKDLLGIWKWIKSLL